MTELETALTVLWQNVRGLCNKYDELFCSLKRNQIILHLICLTDRHLSKQTLSLINLDNYSLGTSYSHILNLGGSVCIYIITDTENSTFDVSQNCIEKYIELCFAQINSKYCHIVVMSIYRSPTGKYSQFLNLLDETLKHLQIPNTKFLIC